MVLPGTLLMICAVAGFAAVTYAAAPFGAAGARGKGEERQPAPARPWRPTIFQHPDKVAVSTDARFTFGAGGRAQRFHCRLDSRGWRACRPPASFAGLTPGPHVFMVRALNRRGQRSGAARFRWRVLEPKDFAIEPRLAGIGALYPGAPAVALPVRIENPNPAPIFVTGLRVAATSDPPGCTRAENLALAPASLSSARPLRVPAGGSASLPAPGATAPTIQLRNLPVNQDACQNARFPLAFAGKARG